MKIVKASFEVLAPNVAGEEFLKQIEVAGRTCYQSATGDAEAFCRRLIANDHGAMLEHAPDISVRIICDRGVSHEIVRHRLFSFAQKSTRYCNDGADGDVKFIQPCWFSADCDISGNTFRPEWTGCVGDHAVDPFEHGSPESYWFWHCAVAERDYLKLLELGWSPQQARSVLPNSLQTEIIVKGNVREWRHFFNLRTASAAHPQMREIAVPMLQVFQAWIPSLFRDI